MKKCAELLPGMRSAASGEQRQWSVKLMGLTVAFLPSQREPGVKVIIN